MLYRVLRQSIPATFRLYLGVVFLIYGGVKIVFGQFGEPSPGALELKGEGFVAVWSFFGYSRPYELFVGWGEVIAALLIMIPRTSTFGALCYLPIAVNVMMVNYFYNIGVQDLSTLLTVMCLVLLWVDRKKLLPLLSRKEDHA
ncbi:hypothetical protein [Paenibacillus turpanensis]|uniref:hypothetical protein n=1 Tax=Paenibacillus turpanensis TaxID=2689078 RepID=UPI00140E899B|nr:hypothetical protein [Paenibacillus turpanensis]